MSADDLIGEFKGETLPASYGDADPPSPPRPVLQIPPDGAKLDATVRAAEAILAPHVFVNGPRLVWIGEARELPAEYGIRRASEQRALLRVNHSFVLRKLSAVADVVRFDARTKSLRETGCPDRVANALVTQLNWPTLRPLDAIVRAPFVRENGTVCSEPGYDPQSRCFYEPSASFPELPEIVTEDDARDALAVLRTPFNEFPWQTPASESAFLAHILTEASRLAVDRVPMFWYSAPLAGTGKGLLNEMPATVVHGEAPAVRPWVESEEIRKNLFASLLAGDRSIGFDNLPSGHKVRSSVLCAFITSQVWKDRRLGESEVSGVPNVAVCSATGNNVTPTGDLARRSLVIRLDADSPDITGRSFRIEDLRAYVLARRVELLMAALTVIRGHQQSGHKGPTPLPSFEKWSRMVRDALLWLGEADPVETQSETESDDSDAKLGEAFTALAASFGNARFTPGEVQSRIQSIVSADGTLANALLEAGCSDPNNSQKIGYFLREHRDKHGGGFKLTCTATSDTHAKKYQLKPTRAAIAHPPAAADKCDLL